MSKKFKKFEVTLTVESPDEDSEVMIRLLVRHFLKKNSSELGLPVKVTDCKGVE